MDDASVEQLHAAIWRGKRRGMLGAFLAPLLWWAAVFSVAKVFAPLNQSWGLFFGLLFLIGGWTALMFGAWAAVRGHRLRCPGCQAHIYKELDVEDGCCPDCGQLLEAQRLVRW